MPSCIKLITDLGHDCSIGYHGPQFLANAKHLSSALQHTSIIDESLKKEMKTGHISSSTCQPPCRSHPSFADSILSQLRDHCQYLGITSSTRCVNESGIKTYYKFCEKFKIQHLPASSLTLQFFCVHNSCYISHKTLKVYLAAIHLSHLEQGLDDPINDHLLHLVWRGICRLQGDKIRK